jgi:FAD/FMN-containing dehydrogenase
MRVLRYGMMDAQVLGLEVVTADGSIQSSIAGLHKDNRGPDPLRLMIGAEGSLGVITRACLRILPHERYSATAWVGCASLEAALDILRYIRKEGYEVLAAFEVMSDSCMPFAALAQEQYQAPLDAPVHILVAFSSSMDLSLDYHLETLLAEAINRNLASDVIISQSEAHGKHFWAIREGVVEGHAKRGYHVRSDVSVKLSLIPEAASRLEKMLAKEFPGWIPQTYGHLGDGNLHYNALPPDTLLEAEARRIGPSIETRIFEIINELSGSFSAEHGIGRKKIGWFQHSLPERHETLAKIKSVLDSNYILNPGCLIDKIEKGK